MRISKLLSRTIGVEMEHNYSIALAITTLAGMATLFGGFLTFFIKKTNLHALSVGLGFSAGVMIFIALYAILHESQDFLIQVFPHKAQLVAFLSFFVGVGVAILVDFFLPAHIGTGLINDHNHAAGDCSEGGDVQRAGILTTLAISIHRFPEGLATFLVASADLRLGIPFAVAIAIHNLPEGIAIALPIYHSTGKKRLALLYTFLASLAGPIGAMIGFGFAKMFLPEMAVGMMFGAVAGIMVYISLDTLLPLAREYGDNHHVTIGIIAGMFFISLSMLLF